MARKQNELVEEQVDELENVDEEANEEQQLTELKDSDPTAGMESMHKSNLMGLMMKAMGGMSGSHLVDFFKKSMDQIGKEAVDVPGGASDKNKKSIAMHAMKEAVEEDLKSVFGENEDLSEDFKTKMSTIFESAVGARVTLMEAEMEEAFEARFEKETDKMFEALVNKMDEYLEYICEEWMKENEVAIQSSLKTEVTEEFIDGMKELFQENYITIPEEKVDVVELLSDRVNELEEQLNDVHNENMAMIEASRDIQKEDVIDQVAEGLTALEQDKFKLLVEEIGYDENYEEKLQTIKEHHFSKKGRAAQTNLITEEIVYDPESATDEAKPVHPDMRKYVAALDRSVKRV